MTVDKFQTMVVCDAGVLADSDNSGRNSETDGDAVQEKRRQQHAANDAASVDPELGRPAPAPKRLTLTFRHITVQVAASGEALGETLLSRMDPREAFPFLRKKGPQRDILQDVTGQVGPGQMLLVLGRPGAGCTSLLRVLANHREGFNRVDGDVFFGSLDHAAARPYRQQIMMNTEDDIHFPSLSVNQTIDFALRNKTPRHHGAASAAHFVQHARSAVLAALGIGHTGATRVGNEYVRGVSGGERKRVSLAETLAGRSPVQVWDQPTRGLDAKTALEFAQTLRRGADCDARTVVATLYQAGNAVFDCFDQVLVLAEGRVLYYGPRSRARAYFEQLGFVCPPGANTADFLTSVTVPTERTVAPDLPAPPPGTPDEFAAAYRASAVYRDMQAAMQPVAALEGETVDLQRAVRQEKKRRRITGPRSVYTAGLRSQVVNCTIRQWQIMLGDRLALVVKVVSAMIQALVCGSLFFQMPPDSSALFLRPGLLFFPVLYFLLEGMSETTASFMGRPILGRHKRFGFYRPTAFCIANALTDIPVVVLQVSVFSIILYFMCGLQVTAGKFFTLWTVTNASTLVFGQFFRMLGALCPRFGTASLLMGLTSTVFMVYGGYLTPYRKMPVWFRWIFYLDPGAYAFESLMANEFDGLELACVAPQYIPFGPGYNTTRGRADLDPLVARTHGCTVAASDPRTGLIDGVAYLHEQFSYAPQHIWRGFGVLVAFWVAFIAVTALAFELRGDSGGSSVLLYKRGGKRKVTEAALEAALAAPEAPEAVSGGQKAVPAAQIAVPEVRKVAPGAPRIPEEISEVPETDSEASVPEAAADEKHPTPPKQSTFCWRNLCYRVHHQGRDLPLLTDVFGFVQPGRLVALMGSSGAGKTTLLDVLAQRKDVGHITGSILVDGVPPGAGFARRTGYCEQMDVHEATATVREALVFSALLRQPRTVPRAAKMAYVEHVLDLLELRAFADALIGEPGAGLSIEQRKRVTLGVELVARPTLLFLDEPTSGLDGQSAYNIVRFLRRLVDGGQAVLCTIHQPSAVLFEAFDSLLLLAKGGKMAYFGETGNHSAVVLDYFARNGAPCPPDVNPADHIVEVIQGKSATTAGSAGHWVDVWAASLERQEAYETLQRLEQAATATPTETDASPFAAPPGLQFRLVLQRLMVQLWRSPDYVWNKVNLHVFAALLGGFTFWHVGDTAFDLQLRLFAVFNFIFVAPGCINQMQPFFLHNRDLFETREKKARTYHWFAFVTAQIVAELPYLVLCATLYFCCWYFTVGLPARAAVAGHVYLQMILYELLYTSVGQAIAAYAPTVYAAAVANPLLIGCGLVTFCGVVVPYTQMQRFWRAWLYWLDPFHYLVGGLFAPLVWDVPVRCAAAEMTVLDPPAGQTCGQYLAAFLAANAGYVANPAAAAGCQYCPYETGADYARMFGINARYYGWRDTGITALFCVSSYLMVILMMKLRSKKTKSARQE